MKVGQSERLTSKSIEAKNILNDINIFDTEEKAINQTERSTLITSMSVTKNLQMYQN